MDTLNHIVPSAAEERNSSFDAVVAAIQGLTRSHPAHAPEYVSPYDDLAYWLCRYNWREYHITIHTQKTKVIVSVHHKKNFVCLANMDAVAEIERHLKRTIPNTKYEIKQKIGGR